MRFEHFVLTVFSIRGPNWQKKFDPLEPNDIEFRFRVFQITCLPSILGQTNQNFSWIVIVDEALEPSLKTRLSALIEQKERAHLFEYSCHSHSIGSPVWFERAVSGMPDYVITTNLDDDDALPASYIAALQSNYSRLGQLGRIPPVKIFGCKDIVQWDLVTSGFAPLGWKCPWHRTPRASSCGFSIAFRYPPYRFSILGLGHSRAEEYLDLSIPPTNDNVTGFRDALDLGSSTLETTVEDFAPEEMFQDLSFSVGPVLMTNHFRNNQADRLYEGKPHYDKVVGAESFPGIPIDWRLARHYSSLFHVEMKDMFPPKRRLPR